MRQRHLKYLPEWDLSKVVCGGGLGPARHRAQVFRISRHVRRPSLSGHAPAPREGLGEGDRDRHERLLLPGRGARDPGGRRP